MSAREVSARGRGAYVHAARMCTRRVCARGTDSAQILAASLGVPTAPTWAFLAIDLPGAVLSAIALVLVGRIDSSRDAVLVMLMAMVASLLLLLGSTALFEAGVLSGLSWQLLLGIGLYVRDAASAGGPAAAPPKVAAATPPKVAAAAPLDPHQCRLVHASVPPSPVRDRVEAREIDRAALMSAARVPTCLASPRAPAIAGGVLAAGRAIL